MIGVDDPATAHDDVARSYSKLKGLKGSHFRLVLSHSTDCLDDVAKYGAELMLTGHTHGGQIRLPGMRKPWITNTYLGSEGIYEGYHIIQGFLSTLTAGLAKA